MDRETMARPESQDGKPEGKPEGDMDGEPDPSQATTVLHGAPPPAAPAAPTMSALGSSAAAAEPPAIESPPAGGTAPDAGGPAGRTWRLSAIGGGTLAALILVVALVARGRSENSGEGASADADPAAGLVEAWRAAGLQPGDFVPVPGDKFAGGDCRSGKVSAIDVTVCLYPTAEDAHKARRAGLRALKGVTRTAIPSGKRLLLTARGAGGEGIGTMEKVTEVFRAATAPPGERKAGRR